MELVISALYMVSAILFVLALGGLSNHETAKRGNWNGIVAMTIAIVSTIFVEEFHDNYILFSGSFVLGGLIGLIKALRVEMIDMP